MRLQLLGDRFGDFALDREDVSQIAIVSLGPKMRVVARVDQLRVHPHFVPRSSGHCLPGREQRLALDQFRAGYALAAALYCITLVRLITFKSATLARLVRISS